MLARVGRTADIGSYMGIGIVLAIPVIILLLPLVGVALGFLIQCLIWGGVSIFTLRKLGIEVRGRQGAIFVALTAVALITIASQIFPLISRNLGVLIPILLVSGAIILYRHRR